MALAHWQHAFWHASPTPLPRQAGARQHLCAQRCILQVQHTRPLALAHSAAVDSTSPLQPVWDSLKLTPDEQKYLLSKLPEGMSVFENEQLVKENLVCLAKQRTSPKTIFLREPRLLLTHLTEWHCFFSTYGFTEDQWRHILWEAPEALANATLVTAGQTMLELKSMGLDEYAIKQMCVYYPQILGMEPSEVASIVRLTSQHNATHGFE